MEITLDDLKKNNDLKQYRLMDIREPGEWDADPLEGVDHIRYPLSEFEEKPFTFNPSERYLIFCALGMRSHWLVEQLRDQGIENVYSLAGGIEAVRACLK